MKNLNDFIGKEVIITRTGGEAGLDPRQKANLKGLGLGKRGSISCLLADNSVVGMLRKVAHLIEVKLNSNNKK